MKIPDRGEPWTDRRGAMIQALLIVMGGMAVAQQSCADGLVPGAGDNWDVSPTICEVCKHITNWSDCAVAAEKAFLAQSPDVQRTENGLKITLGDGKPLIFEGNQSDGDSFRAFRYLGVVKPLAFHLLLRSGNEWWTYVMVHRRTGKQTEMDSFPVVSPDSARVVTAAINELGNFENRLQIWSVEADSLAQEALIFPHDIKHPNPTIEAWGVERPRWIGDLAIEAQVRAVRRDEYSRQVFFDTTAVFIRRNGKWMLK
jgi:hypothetical protein